MSNRYRNLLPVKINGEYEQYDEFDLELSPEDERANVESGLLEIVPQKYRVVGDSEVYGVKKDDEDPTFLAAMYQENEAALVNAGHIERVEAEMVERVRESAPKKRVKEAKH